MNESLSPQEGATQLPDETNGASQAEVEAIHVPANSFPKPPLTEAQIDEMNRRRYPAFLSNEEIKHINNARARGIHHGV